MIKEIKKDFYYYFAGIIVPGIMNFMAIPVFKSMLGDVAYADFNLTFTSLIVVNTALVGWIAQSVVRLKHAEVDTKSFSISALWCAAIVAVVAMLPIAIFQVSVGFGWVQVLLYLLCLFASSQQVTLVALGQAHFRARLILFTEATRTTLFFTIGYVCLLYFGNKNGVSILFAALFLSYIVSATVLSRKLHLHHYLLNPPGFGQLSLTAKRLFGYGFNLMLWFLLNYAIQFGDRYILAAFYDKQLIGNYTAMFDMISRSITLVGAPVLTSSFPILAREFEKGNNGEVSLLIKKLILMEIGALLLAIAAYYLIGFRILETILGLEHLTGAVRKSGLLILIGTFLWQMAMLLHKKFELLKKTGHMLVSIAAAAIVGIGLNFWLVPAYNIWGSAIAFLSASLTYALIVLLINPRWFSLVQHSEMNKK